MGPVIATGFFGAVGIALALEIMAIATTLSTLQHLTAYTGAF